MSDERSFWTMKKIVATFHCIDESSVPCMDFKFTLRKNTNKVTTNNYKSNTTATTMLATQIEEIISCNCCLSLPAWKMMKKKKKKKKSSKICFKFNCCVSLFSYPHEWSNDMFFFCMQLIPNDVCISIDAPNDCSFVVHRRRLLRRLLFVFSIHFIHIDFSSKYSTYWKWIQLFIVVGIYSSLIALHLMKQKGKKKEKEKKIAQLLPLCWYVLLLLLFFFLCIREYTISEFHFICLYSN